MLSAGVITTIVIPGLCILGVEFFKKRSLLRFWHTVGHYFRLPLVWPMNRAVGCISPVRRINVPCTTFLLTCSSCVGWQAKFLQPAHLSQQAYCVTEVPLCLCRMAIHFVSLDDMNKEQGSFDFDCETLMCSRRFVLSVFPVSSAGNSGTDLSNNDF